MLIADYIKAYTSGERVTFVKEVMSEVRELLVEIWRLNRSGIVEEFGDVMHFAQLWLFWRFGVNGEIWLSSMGSVNKFMARLAVWRRLYAEVGLDPAISNFCGNYQKIEKVVKQLGRLGIDRERAEMAFAKIVGIGSPKGV
jgi:hypothetical protein